MRKLVIITGCSSGLGKELALKFLDENQTVIGISRTNTIKHSNFYFLKKDLSKNHKIDTSLETFFFKNNIKQSFDQVVLVNNAAIVLPIDYFHKLNIDQINISYKLNLSTPILLSHFLINKFANKTKQILICNISSGAASRSIINWSMYCTMKSALKMFTECINTDYENGNKVKAFSFLPGVMDTKMQETIRSQKISRFKNVERFRELKKDEKLLLPEIVADSLYKILLDFKKINQSEYNIKDLV